MKKILILMVALVATLTGADAKTELNATYNMKRAYEEAERGELDEAAKFFDQELLEHPKNGYAYVGYAALYLETNDYEEALSAADKALKFLPKKDKDVRARVHLIKGQTLLATADTLPALSELTEAISLNPKLTDAYEERADTYYRLDRYDLSDADYKVLAEINPASVMGNMGLGRNAAARKDYPAAIKYFTKVADMYPKYSSAFAFRAEAHLNSGDYLKAIDDACTALELDSSPKAYALLYEFPKEQMPLVAAKLKGLSAKRPHSGEYYYYTGLIYQYHDMLDQSNEALAAGYDIDAQSCFLEQMARNHQTAGNYNQAIIYIDKALQMNPDDMRMMQAKGDILGESGDLQGAIDQWSRVVDIAPDYYGGYYRRGWFEDVANLTEAALEDYRMATMLGPDFAYAHYGVGAMLERLGQTEQAREAYLKVVELDSVPSDNSCAMYALLALGRTDEAIDFMEKVLEIDTVGYGAHYDAACFYSRVGDMQKSLSHLRTALERGFRRFYHVRHDDDLDAVRKLPEFEAILREYELVELPIEQEVTEVVMIDAPTQPVEIPFVQDGGLASVKCSINELPLNFIFDTGASIVSLSQMEANFMLKNGFLRPDDFVGTGRFTDANGNVSEGAVVNLRSVDFGGLHLENVHASIVANQKAPLLLGQTVLGRLGKIEIDNAAKKLIINP